MTRLWGNEDAEAGTCTCSEGEAGEVQVTYQYSCTTRERTPPITPGPVRRLLGSTIWVLLHLFDSSSMWPGKLPLTVCVVM